MLFLSLFLLTCTGHTHSHIRSCTHTTRGERDLSMQGGLESTSFFTLVALALGEVTEDTTCV